MVFTDIVGSTSTMQADEDEARRRRDRHRSAVESSVDRWRGEVVQFYGDGSLSVFESAVDAVRCAGEIQADVQRPPGVPLRIGIHSGDVVRDDSGVFGDAVNVAARLEALCVAGGVLVSDKVYDEIKNQGDLETVLLGPVHLRNVARPTPVHALALPHLVVPRAHDVGAAGAPAPAGVAVLPFANLTPDPENAWFADGLAEEVINALTRVPGLKVTARTSSFAFRGREQDVREIGRALGVGAILEGSVRRAGTRVRLTAQLIDASDGFHLFSEVYDRTLDDVFAVQDELARTIVGQLSPRLLDTPTASSRQRPHDAGRWDGQAYDLFLRARAEVARWTPPAMRKALELCRRSVEIDPGRPEPWATMGTAWIFLGGTGQVPPAEAYRETETAVARALELDPDDAVALTNRALRLLFTGGGSDAALATLDHALTVAPGLAFAYQARTYALLYGRRFADAVEAGQAAVELDPLSPVYLETLGSAYLAADRIDDARRVLDRALAIDPSFRSATQVLAWTHLAGGDLDRATELMDSLPAKAGFPEAAAGSRGYLYGLAGDAPRAREMLALLEARKIREPDVELDIDMAMVYLGLGEHDRMFERLEAASTRHRGALFFMRWAQLWDDLRDDPRIQALLED